MIQLFADLCLAPESFDVFRVVLVFLAQHLKGHRLMRFQVKCPVYDGHAAAANDILHAEPAADNLPDQS